MTRIVLVVIGLLMLAVSLSSSAAPSAGSPGEAFEPDPPCVPHWVVYAGASGYACHEENSYWVAVGTSWLYLRDEECGRPDRSECSEWYHPDYLYDSYQQCCAAHGGCPVQACYLW